MTLYKSPPVIVVGAGPVGLSTALALHSLSCAVMLIEADSEKFPRPGSRALFLHNDSLTLLNRFSVGLGESFAELGLIWKQRETCYGRRRVYTKIINQQRKFNNLPPFISLRQQDTEALLRKYCVQQGITVHWQSPLERLKYDDDVVILTAGGKDYIASYVVGADGAGSIVRKYIGAEFEGDSSPGFHIVVDFLSQQHPFKDKRTFYYKHPDLDGRNVLIIPFAGGWQVDLQCRLDDDVEEMSSEEGVKKWIINIVGKQFLQCLNWVSTYRFNQVVANTFCDDRGRVLLVGEAAHLFPPYGGRGLNSGIADADAAAKSVALAISANNEKQRQSIIEDFDRLRRNAAIRNCNAARSALRSVRTPSLFDKVKQKSAFALSYLFPGLARWLDSAPYGPVWRDDRFISRY